MSTVYVTQIPHRHDKATGSLVPAINISPATQHGELEVMFPPRAAFYDTVELVKQVTLKLENYDFKGGDSIAPIGDPVISAVVFAALGKYDGNFTVLKWDKNVGCYIPVRISV